MLNVRRFAVVSLFSLCFPLAGVLAQESEFAPPAHDETLIYVIREGRFTGSMNKMWIAVNDRTVARVENDAYCRCTFCLRLICGCNSFRELRISCCACHDSQKACIQYISANHGIPQRARTVVIIRTVVAYCCERTSSYNT